MIASLPLALVLSAVYVLTGAYALVRWSAAMTGPLPPSRRMAELAHLLMSVAMLVMTWTWAGTTGVTAQIVLFTVFAGYFAVDAAYRHRTGSHGCAGGSAHALMAAAMVWMLAAMPLIMPVPVTAGVRGHGAHGSHAGHAGHGAATAATAHTGPAAWAVVLTIGACVALLATTTFWSTRALRGPAVAGDAPLATGPVPPGATVTAHGGGAALATAPAATAAPAPPPLRGQGADAGCHAHTGLGMIAMLRAMVAGW